jgi:hypothetical protein
MSALVPSVRCSTCSAWADTAHILPWVTCAQGVEFACPRHDPGGYWIRLDAHGLPATETTWGHVADKRSGLHAIALLADALHEQQLRLAAEEGEFDPSDPAQPVLVTGGEMLSAIDRRERAFAEATGGRK